MLHVFCLIYASTEQFFFFFFQLNMYFTFLMVVVWAAASIGLFPVHPSQQPIIIGLDIG